MKASSLVSLALGGLGLVMASVLLMTGVVASQNGTPKDITATYQFDPLREKWVKTIESQPVPSDENGPVRKPSNTIVIHVDENNPIKEIVIEEALVIGGTEPILEINGSADAPNTGKISIGKLSFITVDAEELDINADVVRTDISNVVAKDNELDLQLDAVNVVRTSRGAASSLFLGISRTDKLVKLDFLDPDDLIRGGNLQKSGLRVDRIRILGPSTGNAFIENLTVTQTGVMGRIEVTKVEVQDLILRNVSLDDGV